MPYSQEQIIEHFLQEIADETKSSVDEINVDDTFHALGLDSISAVFIMETVEKEYHVDISPLCFWDYPTIRLLAGHIKELTEKS